MIGKKIVFVFVRDHEQKTLFAYKRKRCFVADLVTSYLPSADPGQVNTNTTKYNKWALNWLIPWTDVFTLVNW